MDDVEIGGLRIAGLRGAHLRVASPGRSPTVRIRRDVLAAAGLDEVAAVGLEIESAAAIETQRSRAGVTGAGPAPLVVTVPPPPAGRGQLLLVEDAGAFRWVLPEPARRGRRGAPVDFSVRIDVEGAVAARGLLGTTAKRVLRVLTFELEDPVAGPVGEEFVRRWEEHHRPYVLRTFGPDDYRLARGHALDADEIRALGGGPALLLIHGTNALTHTGFGGLPYDVVRRLAERYGGRVVAFDHPSLSVDPAENCRRLLAMIPPAAELELDVLAHSRGGLVARMLTERAADVGADPARLRVRQVLFVATPNDGTPLADPHHLGSLVDAMTNLLDAVPDDPTNVETLAGIASVVKQLAVGATGGLDGLVAMRPASSDPDGFLAGLNRARPVAARYRAISADYEPTAGSGLSRVAINAFIDRLFAHESNDLVVPTRSVYRWNGASAFPIAERLVLPAERGVDHSSFWSAGEVTQALDTWLTPDPLPAAPEHPMIGGRLGGGDEPDPLADVDDRLAAGDIDGVRAAIRALPERHRRDLEQEVGALLVDRFARGAAAPKAGRVFVLHGIMGSLLAAQGSGAELDRIWISPLRLLGGGFTRLRHPARDPIRAVGLHRTYLPLLIGLDADWEVVPFAYDWRLGLDVAAAELAERIDGPAHLVAHSMGGLVCRMLRAGHRATWDRLVDGDDLAAGGRLVMLGTPSMGSLSIATALTAEDKLVRWLARVDVRHGNAAIQQVIASFPGVYQLLPSGDAGAPLYDASSWRDGQVDEALLERARHVGEQLAADGFDPERMLYVAGTGHTTAAGLRVDGPGRFRFRVTHLGDGRVTHDAGLARATASGPAITKVWYSTADHGGLAKDPTVVAAVSELLRHGATDRLPTEPPAKVRTAEPVATFVTGEQLEPPPFIDGELLTRSPRGLGLSDKDRVRVARDFMAEATRSWLGSTPLVPAPLPALSVHVLHASLEHASHPVVIGHYAGAPIGGAEAWVDDLLRGRLSARQLLGRYPSHPSDVLRAAPTGPVEPGRFAGAIVVGLGEMGDLTPTKLTRAMRNAALEWALASAPTGPVDDDTTAVAVGLSTVLLGSYGPDALRMATVVSALVEGVMLANRELSEAYTGRPVRIDELEFVEVYGQRAEEAGRVVRDLDRYLPEAVRSGSTLRCADRIRIGEGGRSAAPSADYATGMWRRLIVSQVGADDAEGRVALTFTSLGVRARAELLSHVVDNRLLGRMVRDAVGSAQVDGSVNVALFELLLPNDLKRELASVENLVLVVDEHTAAIPWEALADRNAVAGVEPLVKRMGLVRQLQLEDRRDGPVASLKPRALVIGDPPIGAGFPRLEGARREASAVAGQLDAAGLDVDATMVFGPEARYDPGTAGSIIGRLLADDYQIVHIAAHGWYEERSDRGESWGGVVIGPGQYLTAVEINQMRRPPDLVFLNCCHLAAVDSEVVGRSGSSATGPTADELAIQRLKRPQLAASLSRTLMAMGVRAVVAAGWAVDDRAASEFAKAFYDRMLDGESFGPALRSARIAAHQSDGGASNTWAAYQCYGDPGFRISTSTRRHSTRSTPVSANELVRAVEALAVMAGDAGIDIETVREELSRLERIAQANWGEHGDIRAALGQASSACGDLADAVRQYRRALAAAAGDVPISVIEQLANLEMRLAGELGDGEVVIDDVVWTAAQLLDSARGRVDIICALPATPERRAISAGVWKAVAVRTAGRDRQAALKEAARNYFQNWEADGKPYGANNALQLDGTGGLLTKRQRALLMAAIDEPDFVKPGADYWARIAEAELLLTKTLADGTITDAACGGLLYDRYSRIFDERSTPLERSSAVRHTAELAELTRDPSVRRALCDLSRRLATWTRS